MLLKQKDSPCLIVKGQAALGADVFGGREGGLAAGAVALEFGAATGANLTIHRRAAIGAKLLLAVGAEHSAHLERPPARGTGDDLIVWRFGAARWAFCVFRVEFAQALGADASPASQAGTLERVQVCAALGAGYGQGEGHTMAGRPLAVGQRVVAGRAVGRRAKEGVAALGTVVGEERITLRADGGGDEQLLAAKGAVEEKLRVAVGAFIIIVVHGRAAGRANSLPAIGAKAVLQVEGQAAVGAPAAKGGRGWTPGRWLLVLVKRGSAVRAVGGVGGNLGIALGAVNLVGCAALWAVS